MVVHLKEALFFALTKMHLEFMLYCVHQNSSSFLCKSTIKVKLTSYAAIVFMGNIVFWVILRNLAISKIQKKKKI